MVQYSRLYNKYDLKNIMAYYDYDLLRFKSLSRCNFWGELTSTLYYIPVAGNHFFKGNEGRGINLKFFDKSLSCSETTAFDLFC